MRRHLALFTIAIMAALGASAMQSMVARAQRAFDAAEWPSAYAMYTILTDRDHTNADFYGRAIVAAAAMDIYDDAVITARRALEAAVPPDSLLEAVRTDAYAINKPDIYPAILERMAENFPYIRRPILVQQLEYYSQRDNAQATIDCATQLLEGVPDNIRFLTALGNARFKNGEPEKAVEVFNRILQLDPQDYTALITLANYYDSVGDGSNALPLFRRAYALNATPYVAQRISALSAK